jgi:hypothetical protein
MNEKPKSKLRWRILRWGLILFAVLATLAALLVTEENWRGKHAWENYKHAAEARGEKLDLTAIIPPSVPDEQNFFCAPIVAEALEHLPKNNFDEITEPGFRLNFQIYRGDASLWPKRGGSWQKGTLTDLSGWQNYFQKFNATPAGKTNSFAVPSPSQSPAADVLTALSIYNPALEELRAAAQRPAARLPMNYENFFEEVGTTMPWLTELKRIANFLQLRSVAEIQDGQGATALADIRLLLRVNDSIRDQPFLISHLVRIAIQAIALQPIYEGLAQHCWNDTQLADLESALAEKDFLADFQFAMRGERMCAIGTIESWRRAGESVDVMPTGFVTNNLHLMPSAFFYQNELTFAQMYDRYTLPLVNLTNRTVSVAACRADDAEFKALSQHWSFYQALARMTFPAVSKSVEKFALIQAQVDLARVACALERFRLAHGNFPDTLDALAPQLIEKIPCDVINGQPLHYRRTEDGKFILYSVGWDETDDGGAVLLTKGGAVDTKKGDWVWKY